MRHDFIPPPPAGPLPLLTLSGQKKSTHLKRDGGQCKCQHTSIPKENKRKSVNENIRFGTGRVCARPYFPRFDCQYRHYKYFFGAWGGLDLGKMREAAVRLEGEHDYRNFCKMDAKNVHNYKRRIMRCRIVSAGESDVDDACGVSGKESSGAGVRDDWGRGGGAGGVGATGLGALSKSEDAVPVPGAPPRLCYISIEARTVPTAEPSFFCVLSPSRIFFAARMSFSWTPRKIPRSPHPFTTDRVLLTTGRFMM